jgi:hypothetical protein
VEVSGVISMGSGAIFCVLSVFDTPGLKCCNSAVCR